MPYASVVDHDTRHHALYRGRRADPRSTRGGLLNVCVHRIPMAMSLLRPRSRCPRCSTAIRARDNIPVLGWSSWRLARAAASAILRAPCGRRVDGWSPLRRGHLAAVSLANGDPVEQVCRDQSRATMTLCWALIGLLVVVGLIAYDARSNFRGTGAGPWHRRAGWSASPRCCPVRPMITRPAYYPADRGDAAQGFIPADDVYGRLGAWPRSGWSASRSDHDIRRSSPVTPWRRSCPIAAKLGRSRPIRVPSHNTCGGGRYAARSAGVSRRSGAARRDVELLDGRDDEQVAIDQRSARESV